MEPWQLRSIVAMAKFFPKMVKWVHGLYGKYGIPDFE
jgi:hypothetical protein